MFRVVIQALDEAADRMRGTVRKLNQQIQSLEQVLSSLRRISEYDEIRQILRRRLQEMGEEKQHLMELIAVLEQTRQMYYQCEQNIAEFGDQIRTNNYYRAMNVVQLDHIDAGILEYRIR